uniref:Uncharacterized protein n=1 Tax=Arundo donax TaxID=35708 RepID=A0A0A8Z9S8_ARUDO
MILETRRCLYRILEMLPDRCCRPRCRCGRRR